VNAALLTVAILALSDQGLAVKLKEHREKMRREVEAADGELSGRK
jgi:phosphoribosylcarboxyaminoimidazole (NCAIR) mutase